MTTVTALPATAIDKDTAASLPVAENPAVGDTVVIHSRGAYRMALVVKVGPKRITVEYTTAGAWTEAERIASINREAGLHANRKHALANAERYRAMAKLIEDLGIEVTGDRNYPDTKFVPLASLPAEYRTLDTATGGNAARTTIVYSPAQLREWAAKSEAGAEKALAGIDAAREYDAKPLAERIVQHVHVTTKAVARAEVLSAPAA